MHPQPILQATALTRSFGSFVALAPTDLTLRASEIVALTGPNGAGKSTLLACLSGLLRPSSGTVQVDGHDLYRDERAAKRALAFVPDVPHFYTELTAWEHLRFIALAHDAGQNFDARAGTLLRDFGLWDARDLYPYAYSRGMRLKLGLVLALIRPFRVLLLDEPTSGLDAASTALLRDRLAALRDQGAAILLATHDRTFLKGLVDRTARLQQGQLEVERA